ncbi:hypothetical protein C8A00DRAFT_34090 [Chaetomidium leptoderma]|uniref:Uncharacterized protein n=1 Tax=Chaetomidium leptoderma TaxID=669021 RepID=A0AAN6ZY72_9PEZI|nr:hypothetical protein C8A00DRAFT_34090 [Chaetomidium leptoderma]
MEINPAVVSTQDEAAALANRLNELSIQRPGHMHQDYAHFIRLPGTNELKILEYAGHGGKANRTRSAAPRPGSNTQSQSQNTNGQNQPRRGDQNPSGGNDGKDADDSDGDDRRRRGPLAEVAEHSLPHLRSLDRVLQTTDPEISRDIRWLKIDSHHDLMLLYHLVSLERLQHPWQAVLERARHNLEEGTRRKQAMLRYYHRTMAGKPLEYVDPFIALLQDVEVRDGNLARFLDQHRRLILASGAGAGAADFQRDVQKRLNSFCSMQNDEFFWWAERAIMRVLSQFDAQSGDREEPPDGRFFMPGITERLIGIVKSIYTQAWAHCSTLSAESRGSPSEVMKHVHSFIRKSLAEDERTRQSTDLAVVVHCFVGKVSLDVAKRIFRALKTGTTECATDDGLEIPKILRHSRARGGLLKDTYKIWLVASPNSDPTFRAAGFVEADPGPLVAYQQHAEQQQQQPPVNLDELSRVCAAVHERLRPVDLPVALFFSATFPEPGTPHLLVFKGQWLIKVVSISPQEMEGMGWRGPGPYGGGVQQTYARFYVDRLEDGGIPVLISMEEDVLGGFTPAGRFVSWKDAVEDGKDE